VVLTLVTAIDYAVVHNAYEKFYGGFGLTPEDLGFDSTTIVAKTAFGVFATAAILLALPLLLLVVSAFRPSERKELLALGSLTLIGALILLWAVLWNNLPLFAGDAAQCAREGNSVRFVRSVGRIPGFGHVVQLYVNAQPAKVVWINGIPAGVDLSKKIMFLGESAGTTTLYDIAHETVVRFPSSSAVVTTKDRRVLKRGDDRDICEDFDEARR
jgi:hypothetical protein